MRNYLYLCKQKLMKNTLLALITLCSLSATAQITLEHTFSPVPSINIVLMSANGTKIWAIDTGTTVVKIYDTDYTLWKSIPTPAVAGYKLASAMHVSDNLFNSDNSVELIAIYSNFTTPPYGYKSLIIDESGGTILDLGNCYGGGVSYINGVHKLGTYSNYDSKMYVLPGSLPCGHCGIMGVPKTSNSQGSGASLATPVPNPSTGTASIAFSLPVGTSVAYLRILDAMGSVVETYTINPGQDTIGINTSTLPTGVFTCVLVADNMQVATTKLAK
jgi:hypothetical protein